MAVAGDGDGAADELAAVRYVMASNLMMVVGGREILSFLTTNNYLTVH